MIFSQTCIECNRLVHITYEEDDGTPNFCPFCSIEIEEAPDSFYEDSHEMREEEEDE